MTIVKIIGLERPAVMRAPNGIECDSCGKQINFDRAEARYAIEDLRASGWTIPSTAPNHAETFCPVCSQSRQEQTDEQG